MEGESEARREWKFRYRVYKKRKAIQFKPHHDKDNHFSIIWTKGKGLTVEEFDSIEAQIRKFLEEREWKLTFTVLRACTNCTYGRFDPTFEELILRLRKEYPGISRVKDLPPDDPKHAGLAEKVKWDVENPIIHHVHGRSKTGVEKEDREWEALFRGPDSVEDISMGLLYGTTVVVRLKP